MLKQKFVVSLLVLIFALFALPQGYKEVLKQIDAEKKLLQEYEAQISRLRVVAEKKSKIKNMQKNGDSAGIVEQFRLDSEAIDGFIAEPDVSLANDELSMLKIIYKNIEQQNDEIQYYIGMISKLAEKPEQALDSFELVVKEYPESSKFDDALLALSELYFEYGQDWELINLYDKYNNSIGEKQKFWLANAYYNVEMLDKAQTYFQELTQSKVYNVKAEIMLATIDFFNFGIDKSIESLLSLEGKYSAEIHDYKIIILQLARLYNLNGNYDQSLAYYLKMNSLLGKNIDDGILYETAQAYKLTNDFENAITLLEKIVNNPSPTEYFTSAKYLMAVINQEKGNYNVASDYINEAITQVDDLLDVLNKKFKLLNEHKDLTERIAIATTQQDTVRLISKLEKVEQDILDTSSELDRLSVGLPPEQLERLKVLENEYLSYNKAIENLEMTIRFTKNTPNKKIPARIDQEIAQLDSSAVRILAMSYVANLPEITVDDFDLANKVANEVFFQRNLLSSWDEIENSAKKKNDANLLEKAKKAKRFVQENLTTLQTVIEFSFGNMENPNYVQESLSEEAKIIGAKQDSLRQLKNEVIAKYNLIIANKLAENKSSLVGNNKILRDKYNKLVAEIKDEAAIKSQDYNFTLVDILYKQAMRKDKEFKEFRSNENKNSESEN